VIVPLVVCRRRSSACVQKLKCHKLGFGWALTGASVSADAPIGVRMVGVSRGSSGVWLGVVGPCLQTLWSLQMCYNLVSSIGVTSGWVCPHLLVPTLCP
jgi:hypothetical protein